MSLYTILHLMQLFTLLQNNYCAVRLSTRTINHNSFCAIKLPHSGVSLIFVRAPLVHRKLAKSFLTSIAQDVVFSVIYSEQSAFYKW